MVAAHRLHIIVNFLCLLHACNISPGQTATAAFAATVSASQKLLHRNSQPISVRLPAEYSKVIEQLAHAREKVLQAQALNELGDVHAHLAAWPEALQAWQTATDLIVGPYQVLPTCVLLASVKNHGALITALPVV